MSYRPPKWKNPYSDPHWNDDGEVSGMEEGIYEAGADAMYRQVVLERLSQLDSRLANELSLNTTQMSHLWTILAEFFPEE